MTDYKEKFEKMRIAGNLAARTLDMLTENIKEGISTDHIDKLGYEFIRDNGGYSAPLYYRGFTKSLCTSLNHVICHGIPSDRILQEGDAVNVDVTAIVDEYYGDTSRMFCIGKTPVKLNNLINATYESTDFDQTASLRKEPFEITFDTETEYTIKDVNTGTILASRKYNALDGINYQGVKVNLSANPSAGNTFLIDGDDDGICDAIDTKILGYAKDGVESEVFEAIINQSGFIIIPNLTGMESGTWSIIPALPAGLDFSGTMARSGETGIISGIPIETSPMTNYTVFANNSQTGIFFNFSMAVLADTDGDGLTDLEENTIFNTDMNDNDTDDDGYADNWTALYNGSNAEGIQLDACPSEWGNSTRRSLSEYAYGCPDTDGDGYTDTYVYDIDPDTGLRVDELGDAFPYEKTQSRDRDGDGFGDTVIDSSKNSGRADAFVPGSNIDEFREYQFSVDDLDEFTGFKVKIVCSGTNEAFAPRFKDFRAIALA